MKKNEKKNKILYVCQLLTFSKWYNTHVIVYNVKSTLKSLFVKKNIYVFFYRYLHSNINIGTKLVCFQQKNYVW